MTSETNPTTVEDRDERRFMHVHARGMDISIGRLAVYTATAPVGLQAVVDHLRPTKQGEQAPEHVLARTDGAALVERQSATARIGHGRTA